MIKNKLFKNLGFNGLNSLISWGASVVIIGLMFKILHWTGGEFLIATGLIVESLLFLLLGFVKENNNDNEMQSGTLDQVSYMHYLQMEKEVNNCKHQLDRLGKNLETINSLCDGVIKSIKTNVNK
jgi:hypothetical protein